MDRIRVKELIELLLELPEDVKEKEIEYVDFSWVSKDDLLITLSEDETRVIIREE